MRHLFPHSTRYPSRIRARRRKEAVMNHLYDRQDSTTALPTKTLRVPRRDFLKTSAAIGGGLCFAAYVPELAARPLKDSPANDASFAPNSFVRIAPDDSVTIIANHSEMGQGIYTSLPMLLNEELEADWSRIKVEAAPVDAAYNHTVFGLQMTGGSTTTPSEWERFRKMGAMARLMLFEAAAQKWSVPASQCHVEKGVVIHNASGRRASYGSLVVAASQLKPPTDIPLKEPTQNFRPLKCSPIFRSSPRHQEPSRKKQAMPRVLWHPLRRPSPPSTMFLTSRTP